MNKETRIIAMYLPQFHRVEENDIWWGEGFTDWVSAQNAKSYFDGHNEPKVPLGKNYYDLSCKQTMEWQADLMHQYGIDGVCIYHYWFKNGRRILEKPAENLLAWNDIDMPFCFCWANETWARTWSNLTDYNCWSSESETENRGNISGILLEQKYGNQADWERHFNYLLPFFMDDRYIKINEKPVMVFYKVCDIHCFENMIDFWEQLAKRNGLKGIYVVGNRPRESQKDSLDKVFVSEPAYSMSMCRKTVKNGVTCYDYDEVWEKILGENIDNSIIGAFVNYDDTPRRGKNGTVIENSTPEKFERYLSQLFQLNRGKNNELLFINAWNEWGEGMYLEPDEKFKYEYLYAIKKAKFQKCKEVEKIVCDDFCNENVQMQQFYEKEKHFRIILDKWLKMKEKGQKLSDIFEPFRGKRIAIYGYGILGRHLLEELRNTEYVPDFIIDKADRNVVGITIYKPTDNWPEIDVIIVSATFDYGTIYRMLKKKNPDWEIVSLEHLLIECCGDE